VRWYLCPRIGLWALNLSEQASWQGYPYHGLPVIISALSINSLTLFFFFFSFLENFLPSSTTYLRITLPENISTNVSAPMPFLRSDFAQYILRYLLLLLIILQLLCPPLEMMIIWFPFHNITCRHVRSETGSLHPMDFSYDHLYYSTKHPVQALHTGIPGVCSLATLYSVRCGWNDIQRWRIFHNPWERGLWLLLFLIHLS
jgi:hypothetical protein